jgi:hypothetical protein
MDRNEYAIMVANERIEEVEKEISERRKDLLEDLTEGEEIKICHADISNYNSAVALRDDLNEFVTCVRIGGPIEVTLAEYAEKAIDMTAELRCVELAQSMSLAMREFGYVVAKVNRMESLENA